MDVDVIEKTADERYKESIRVKQGIYTICFVLLCLIDQIMGSAMGRVQFVAANCTGFIIAVIIFTGYRWKDFMRLPYAVWTVFCIVGGYFVIRWGRENYAYFGKWVTAVMNVAIYGYLVLRILIRVFQEKRIPRMNWRFFILWVVMMLCMVFSRNEAVWPLWFLVMFGCFYLTEYTKEELDALFNGMLNGIIIGFCILQGFATMFRAFDEVRYTGMYTNSNMNALFYLIVHTAILGKWYEFKKKKSNLAWRTLTGISSGVLMAYCFLTIGRTAMIVMFLNTILLIALFFYQDKGKRYLKAIGRLAAVLASAVIAFPAVFFSVRWIPAEFYSPMTLAGDAGNKIQGVVPVRDERYIAMHEFLEAAMGRLFWFFHSEDEKEESDNDETNIIGWLGDIFAPVLIAEAAEETSGDGRVEKKPWGSGLSKEDPVLTDDEDVSNSVTIRWGIYKTYLDRLNFKGHKNNEDAFWLTERFHVPHAHNFLIQIMFSYGIHTGILFSIIVITVFLHCLKRCLEKMQEEWFFIAGVLMIASFVAFGTLEVNWRIGQISFTALFVVQYLLLNRGCEREKR